MNKAQAVEEIERARAERSQQTSPAWIRLGGGAVFLLVLLGFFGLDLLALARHAAAYEIHSHIVLVPLISAYLIYVQRERLPKSYSPGWLPALCAVIGGLMVVWARHRLTTNQPAISYNDQLALAALALVFFVVAGGFLFMGAQWMKAVSFPAFFLIFAIPLPDHLVEVLETGSKLGSAEVANVLFNLSGTPVFREGVYFQIPGMLIEVAQECSGIRSSWVLLITSLLAAHMFLSRTWSRAVLVLFIIPLGLLRNGFRILVIGLLCVHIGPEMIDSTIHRRGGPFFFALSLIPLFFLLRYLRKNELRLAAAGR